MLILMELRLADEFVAVGHYNSNTAGTEYCPERQPGKQLPDHIQDFVDGSKDGVIIVSFGTFIDHLPDDIIAKLCSGFTRLKQNIIWKLKNKQLCQAPKNKMLLLDWLPQNDILAHPNVKLFVSHCGIKSIMEAMYHNTPILGIPITFDQPFNSVRMEHKKQGLKMSLKTFTEEELVSKVNEILTSSIILESVKRASDVMKDKMMSPGKRASYWVNHVMKYGDKHLRTGAYKLSDLQFFMFDIYVTFFVLFIVVALVLFVIARCCCKCLIRVVCRKRKSKKE